MKWNWRRSNHSKIFSPSYIKILQGKPSFIEHISLYILVCDVGRYRYISVTSNRKRKKKKQHKLNVSRGVYCFRLWRYKDNIRKKLYHGIVAEEWSSEGHCEREREEKALAVAFWAARNSEEEITLLVFFEKGMGIEKQIGGVKGGGF